MNFLNLLLDFMLIHLSHTDMTSPTDHNLPATAYDFLKDFIHPVSISDLDKDEQECTICYVRYGQVEVEDDPGSPSEDTCEETRSQISDAINEHNNDEEGLQMTEGPVRIQPCNHVFGSRCLEKHVQGLHDYSRRCPKCRAQLFDATSEDLSDDEQMPELEPVSWDENVPALVDTRSQEAHAHSTIASNATLFIHSQTRSRSHTLSSLLWRMDELLLHDQGTRTVEEA